MSKRKLHIGGNESHPEWEILNINDGPHVDHCMDLRDLSSFEDDTFSEIYASHILEHFDYQEELLLVLAELFRILIPGGKLYASVPDMDSLCTLFTSKNITFQEQYLIMRMIFGGHVDQYDYHLIGLNQDLLEFYLKISGFINFKKVENFNLFSDASSLCINGQPISINIISEKPWSTDHVKENYEIIFKSAIEYHQQGEIDLARMVYQSILQKYPDHADALHLLGVLTSQAGLFDQGIELIQRAIDIYPDNPVFFNNLGTIYFQHGNYTEAVDAFENTVRLNPSHLEAYKQLESCLKELGMLEEANAVNKKIEAINTDSEN